MKLNLPSKMLNVDKGQSTSTIRSELVRVSSY